MIPAQISQLEGEDELRGVPLASVAITIQSDTPPSSISEAYLRLSLLSHCLVAPNTRNLKGLDRLLPIVAVITGGPIHPVFYEQNRLTSRKASATATSLDKFGPLLNCATLPQVRIADASRDWLGAHLAPGTTIVHEGFVNFNAGTLGSSMVEGESRRG